MKRLSALLLLPALLTACDPADDPATQSPNVRSANGESTEPSESTEPQARRIVLEGDLDMETIQALGKRVEGLADVNSVRIEVQQHDDNPTIVSMTVAGADLPSNEELTAEVLAFEGVGDADVEVSAAEPPAGPIQGEVEASSDADMTPEEVKAQVIADLRAKGVEGDIHVDVVDEDGERHVEVRVEQHEDQDEAQPE